ncbi:MAG: heme-binding domain-containing protein [Bacteroidota bacterium]
MRKSIAFLAIGGLLILVMQASVLNQSPGQVIPEDVEDVLKSACFDCHSNDASSKKGKIALNFDKWESFKDSKKISKMGKICKVVEEGKMPPEKYLKSKPDRAMTEAQKAMVCEWAAKETEKLMEGN